MKNNESPAPTINGQTSSVHDTDKEGFIECLDKLKASPFNDCQYQLDLMNLCGAIVTIADDLCGTMQTIKEYPGTLNVELIQKRLFQICTISDVINDKINTADFDNLQELIYFYKKQVNETKEK